MRKRIVLILSPTHLLIYSQTHTLIGRVASLLEVGTGFHPELTGRENVYLNGAILGMTKNVIKFTPTRAYERLLGGRIT